MTFIVICLSRSEGKSENFLVSGPKGEHSFATLEEAQAVVKADMAEYLEAEVSAGRDARIEGNHIEWGDDMCDRDLEARWYIYSVPPPHRKKKARRK